jgi:hypothetical protein
MNVVDEFDQLVYFCEYLIWYSMMSMMWRMSMMSIKKKRRMKKEVSNFASASASASR